MKKLYITLLILLLTSNAYAVTDFYVGDMKTIWDAAQSANNSQWTSLETRSDQSLYDDYGIVDAIRCRADSDNSYCVTAVNKIQSWIGRDGDGNIPTDNQHRDWFTGLSIVYGLACVDDKGGAPSCAEAKDTLNYWTDMALQDYDSGPSFSTEMGIRLSDSDELVGKGFGVFLFAAAIKTDDATRYNEIIGDSYLDGWTSTDNGTIRGRIYNYFTNKGAGGEWVESTYYNMGTVQYPFVGVKVINDALGESYFPEIVSAAIDYVEAGWQRQAPNLWRQYKWGDEQSRTSTDTWPTCGYLSSTMVHAASAEACYVLNFLGCITSYTKQYKYPYLNSGCTSTAPSGQTDFYAEGMGQFYWHEDWDSSNQSFYGGHFRAFSAVDHDSKGWRNFNVWRNGNWAILNPKFYYGDYYQEMHWINSTLVHGAFPVMPSEARGLHLAEGGANYMYSVGVAGGHQVRSWDTKPPESLHENSASLFYIHHADDSDTVISFDRINSENPITLGGVNYYLSGDEDDILDASGKHQVQFFCQNNPSISGTRVTWTAKNSLTSYWDTFIPGFNAGTDYSESLPTWIPDDVEEYRVILTVNNTSQHQTFANIFHQGSVPTYTEYLSTVGEAAKAYKIESGSENTMVVFNAADRTSDLPSPTTSGWDSSKFDQLKQLHFFKDGFTLPFSADTDTEVFIVDLNPSAGWEYSVDGGATTSLEESSAGLFNFTVSGSGNHTIYVNNTGSTAPSCIENPDYCYDQSACEAATYCWEDRGSGNDCYSACEVVEVDCSSDCIECTIQVDCEASAASNCDGTGNCCWHSDTTTCDSVPDPDCDDNCQLCANETACNASALTCYYWSTDQCQTTAEPVCADDPDLCYTQTDCLGAGYVWCNDDCLTSAPSAGIIENTNCGCAKDENTTLNCTCNVESCENQIMIVSVSLEETEDAPTSVVWKDDPNEDTGQSLTRIDTQNYWSSGGQHLYYLLNPDVGIGGKITVVSPTSSPDIAIAMQSVCGLVQQAPEATAKAGQDATVTSITASAYIISGISSITGVNFTADSPLVEILEKDGLGQTVSIGSYQAGAAGGQACNWTPSAWTSGGNVSAAFEVSGSVVCEESSPEEPSGAVVSHSHQGKQSVGSGGW